MNDIHIITRDLAVQLIPALQGSNSVYMVVSFAMKTGIELLLPHLKAAVKRGADIKILTGDYLYVTEPEALTLLLRLGDGAEVRLWRSHGTAFHPKAYLLGIGDEDSTLIVGSSNLSKSALTSGIEWNISVTSAAAEQTVNEAYLEFMRLFYNDRTTPINGQTVLEYEVEYRKHYSRPNLGGNPWSEPEDKTEDKPATSESEYVQEIPLDYNSLVSPNEAQLGALEEIRKSMEEGYDKALVVMATGLGKTYLAAFLACDFRRVLFIAHREEILEQAQRSFRRVLPDRSMGIFNGSQKVSGTDCVFASILTLAMARHRKQFQPDDFDLIVVDEFHHAAAASYRVLLEYFKPKFLLGITATPDRADGRDIFAFCDGNLAYRMNFIEAIQKRWLSPFKYYGVYDETDYSKVTWLGTRYDEEELAGVQLRDEAAKAAYNAWMKHKQLRTLAFCSSIRQANFLSKYFSQNGVRSISLHSETEGISRHEAIRKLTSGDLDVIFTVDLFNEGVDIPSVDTLLFVRPTESLTVLTQQIGRGLRLHSSKSHCHIIDLIGNYRNADIKLRVFDTKSAWADTEPSNKITIPIVPDNCEFNLDTKVIDLVQEMARKRNPRRERLLENYRDVKRTFGRRPSYLELHLHGALNVRAYHQEFGSYVGFIDWAGELNSEEKDLFQKYKLWLTEVESTVMTKSYKMVVLRAMLRRGPAVWTKPVRPEDVAPFFHRYFMEKEYRKRIDFSDTTLRQLWIYDERGVSRLIATMPMAKWAGSSEGLVEFENGVFRLAFEVGDRDSVVLHEWTLEVCEYRLHAYFERKTDAK